MQNFLKTFFKGDSIIWMVYAFLMVVSMVTMYSASATLTRSKYSLTFFSPTLSHISFLVSGAIITYVIYRFVKFKWMDSMTYFVYGFSIVLLIFTMLRGVSTNGASRWISIGGVQFQPSELAKFALVFMMAKVLTLCQNRKDMTPDDGFWKYFLVWIIPSVFILRENFSTFALVTLVCACMCFFARLSWKLIGRIGGIVLLSMLLLLAVVKINAYVNPVDEGSPTTTAVGEQAKQQGFLHRLDTWVNRFTSFSEDKLDDDFKITDKNYQSSHAHIAVANGKWLGLGPGNSIERDFLPQAFSDFIYAIILEEYGVIGGFFVLLAYLILLFRVGSLVCNYCQSAMQSFVVLGFACMMVFQAMVNISVAVGLMPVTGQPLPLISRGGTSIWMTCMMFGVILNVSKNSMELAESEKLKTKKSVEQETTPAGKPQATAVEELV